ncbi:MAG TPA: Crp/Fnr family transcriptional regulator [Lachnospiraceae bacterium]|nr:Crp/Fnr family transcriptional regulator [Lachnospiraceae bacterium]
MNPPVMADWRNSSLFLDIPDAELKKAWSALHALEKNYAKDAVIYSAGDTVSSLGLVLYGSVRIESMDLLGNRRILSHIRPGDVFAETYAFQGDLPLLTDAVANEDCRILFLETSRKTLSRYHGQIWHERLLMNLLAISNQKNFHLAARSFHTSPHNIRDRVIAFLSSQAVSSHSSEFDIPFDRQQMADYLNLDRSALSKELGRMRRDGLIDFRKNHFQILRIPHAD